MIKKKFKDWLKNAKFQAGALLILILAIGFGLRIYGIYFGMPSYLAADERDKVEETENLEKHNFKHTNKQPSFLYNSLYLSFKAYDKVNNLVGNDSIIFHNETTSHHLVGRVLMASIGTITIAIVYLLAYEITERKSLSLVAAAFLAVVPIHVITSQYIKEDTLLTFWVTMSFLFFVKIVKSNGIINYILAGLCTGLAISSKYTAVVLVPFIILAHFAKFSWPINLDSDYIRNELKKFLTPKLLAALIFLPIGFFIASPIILTDINYYWQGFIEQKQYATTGHIDGIIITPWQYLWTYYLTKALIPGVCLSTVTLIFWHIGKTIKSIITSLRKLTKKQIIQILVMFFCGGFYFMLESSKARPYPFFSRYLLPIIPLLCIFAAQGLHDLYKIFKTKIDKSSLSWFKKNRITLIHFAILFLLPPFIITGLIKFEAPSDTRIQAIGWMEENVTKDDIVMVPNGYNPHFPANLDIIKIRDREQKMPIYPTDKNVYFMTNSFRYGRFFENPEDIPELTEFYSEIFNNNKLVKELKPDFRTYGFHNPVVRIYQINKKDEDSN